MGWIITFFILPLIIYDWKERSIPMWSILLFGIIQILLSLYQLGIRSVSINILLNITILSLLTLTGFLYFKIKYKSAKSIIGLGDILFISFLTPAFEPQSFLVFLIISFSVSLILWLVAYLIKMRQLNESIPLVSIVGVCYISWNIYLTFTNI